MTRTAEQFNAERETTLLVLRSLCGAFGDNDWSDDLHLADVIDKHLGRYLHAPKSAVRPAPLDALRETFEHETFNGTQGYSCGLCASVGPSFMRLFEPGSNRKFTADIYCETCWNRLGATFAALTSAASGPQQETVACNFVTAAMERFASARPCAEVTPDDQTQWCGRCLLAAHPEMRK